MSDKITIFHNTRCSKSRCVLTMLEENRLKPEIRNYMEAPPSVSELRQILQQLGIKAEELVRKGEKMYKENYKGKVLTEDEWIKVLSENPRLIERPIVIKGDKAVIGRPPEKVALFLKS